MKVVWVALLATVPLNAQFSVQLSSDAAQTFSTYVQRVEVAPGFHSSVEIKSPVAIKGALIHDIRMSQMLSSVTVDRVLALFADYDNYKNVFAPEVAESRLLSHEGNRWRAALQLKRKKVLTAVLNTEYDVERRDLGGGRVMWLSRSTKSAEVDSGVELPDGQGHGYLWRLNAYWLIEPQAGGVYLECRSISLTRDIPLGLGWAIRPIVASLPKESLEATFAAIKKALR